MLREGTAKDFLEIAEQIKNKNISYITPEHIRKDIENHRQYVLEENGNIIAIAALVAEPLYNYTAIKRLCILSDDSLGKGYADKMIKLLFQKVEGKCGCTPWITNGKMIHILEKNGFILKYIFNEKWCFYLRDK